MLVKTIFTAAIISITAVCNLRAAANLNGDTTFHATGNPIIKLKFTADPGVMVYKDKAYLYYNPDGTIKHIFITSEGVKPAK